MKIYRQRKGSEMTKKEENSQQTMLNALSDLQAEVKNLRTELNRLEGSLLRERVKAVEQALSQNRLMQYSAQLQDELNEDLEKIAKPDCQNRLRCIEAFRAVAAENLKMTQQATPTEALEDLDAKIEKIGKTAEKAKGKPCEECHRSFQKKLKREKRAFQTIVLVEKTNDEAADDQQMNIDGLVENMLEPLANSVRLRIFLNVYEGKKSFSKLSQISNLKGGHLIFHLKKLLDSGLIAQEENKGDYIITQKGVDVIKKILLSK